MPQSIHTHLTHEQNIEWKTNHALTIISNNNLIIIDFSSCSSSSSSSMDKDGMKMAMVELLINKQ